MMEAEFVPYEQALALKELDFNEPCLLHIQYSSGTDISGRKYQNSIWLGNGYEAEINNKKIKYKFPKHSEQGYGTLQIPTFSQCFRWFREKYKLVNYIEYYAEWNFEIFRIDDKIAEVQDDVNIDYTFNGGTYKEAELECLRKLIEIVKKK